MKPTIHPAPMVCLALLASAFCACSDSNTPNAASNGVGTAGNGSAVAGNGGTAGSSGNAGTGSSSGNAGTGSSSGNAGTGGSSGNAGAGGTMTTDGGTKNPDSGSTTTGGGMKLAGTCPSGFVPKSGKNTGFTSGSDMRDFHVLLPQQLDTPRPVFVSLTGTVQPETDFLSQSALDQLPKSGWIVLAPVRTCSQKGTNCNMQGTDGRVWEPWFDGTNPPRDDPGPDVKFVEEMVRCAATVWPVDQDRIYVGGISAGGSFTNHNLLFNSDFFAGGVDASGNWYGGGVAPKTPMPMKPSIVIVMWGGTDDKWPLQNPIANYAPETKSAAMFYSQQTDVVTLACSGTHGHQWPSAATPWFAETLLSHPKGTTKTSFMLKQPPTGFSCVLGAYTDH